MTPLRATYDPDDRYSFPGKFWTYRRMVKWDECAHLLTPRNARERRNIEEEYGRNSPFVKSMVYGEFSTGDEETRIYTDVELQAMEISMAGNFGRPLAGDMRAAGDISGGGDGCAFMLRRGTEILEIDDTNKKDELAQAEYWVAKLRGYKMDPYQFCMDGQGMGATVELYMRRIGFAGVNLFMANNRPMYKWQYYDRYTEIHWLLKDMLRLKILVFHGRSKMLLRDMKSRRYVVKNDNSIKTEPKEDHRAREKFSPDYLDTLVYLFSDFNPYALDEMMLTGKRVDEIVVDDDEPTEMERKALEASDDGMVPFGSLPRAPSFQSIFSE